MTIKPRVQKFRIRRDAPAAPQAEAVPPAPVTEPAQTMQDQLDAIAQEGLTGRQLRMARRVAQKQGLIVGSDYDAVRQLRLAGIDPFQRQSVLELVQPKPANPARVQLPETIAKGNTLPDARAIQRANKNASEIIKIQRDIARRRRRKLVLLTTRLAVFIFLPTFLVGWYFYNIATPMYATNSEIVIQQAQPAQGGAGGFSNLFQGTSMATQQDSIAVQSYLASREAMLRLDADHGFKAHFSDPAIDAIQRLDADATNEEAFKLFKRHVVISYDPTEGLIRMEVIAASPEKAFEFSQALIGYAEEQVDQLTSRLRADQMQGAQESYEAAERRRSEALAAWLAIQQEVQQIDPVSESATRLGQIATLEGERQRLELVLQSRLNVERPSEVQVQALRDQIANIDGLIVNLRADLIGGTNDQGSLAARNTELLTAEENYTFQTLMVQQALTQMETARIEANRQVRYLSESVRPVLPDQATYPRAFENTILAFLIFSGIYLMISLTASILREQVSS
ncbi:MULTISPECIES: capsule biosynthesis protein [unclassified Yoonia]|uniref:capsule biosynthesis protein n=1 Tax=unclassified Yoonia TaxID=2629118 RepID=UPI002AFE239A|nr:MULTISPECIES: capsule biosynthesis protein [unclassified Yoonia]